MRRGTTVKKSDNITLQLERRMITRHHLLKLDRQRCAGCDLCLAVCPQEAIKLQPGVLEAGKLLQRPLVDIDQQKCNFCGECVIVCPFNALSMLIDGEVRIPVLEHEAFPALTKQIIVDASKLPAKLAAACEECCPTGVISIEVKRDGAGKALAVQNVQVDETNCIYCKQCEATCPEAFSVTHPFEGLIRLENSLCPQGCQACADICPSHALWVGNGKLALDERFCLFCGACTQVCPVPEALLVKRHRVRHAPIKSGAWIVALEKLISLDMAAEELELKSQAKRRNILSFMPGASKKQEPV